MYLNFKKCFDSFFWESELSLWMTMDTSGDWRKMRLGKTDQSNHKGSGAMPSGLDLLFYAKENLPLERVSPPSPRHFLFSYLPTPTDRNPNHKHTHWHPSQLNKLLPILQSPLHKAFSDHPVKRLYWDLFHNIYHTLINAKTAAIIPAEEWAS